MMKVNKACGPDLIHIEVWKKMGEEGIVFLKKELNEMLTYVIPSSWRLSEVTPLFKGKGSLLECSNYRGIKLISHTLTLLERIIDQRLRTSVELGNILLLLLMSCSTHSTCGVLCTVLFGGVCAATLTF